YFLIVSTAEGVKSYEEFVAKAKAKPGAMNFGVIPNSQLQLDTTRILRASGVEAELIPYAGTAPITTALLGHEINAYLGTLSGMKQYFDSGRLMPLATTSAMPTPLMPELPTFTSKGVNVEATAWYAVSTTAGVPADVVEKIAHDLRTVIESPDYVAKVQAAGYEPTSSTP